MATRSAKQTDLIWGVVKTPVALYSAVDDKVPGAPEFDRAGPNGRPLLTESRPKGEAVSGEVLDPFAPEPVQVAASFPSPPIRASFDAMASDASPPASTPEPLTNTVGPPPEYEQVLVEEGTRIVVPRDEVRRGIREGDEFTDLTEAVEGIDDYLKTVGDSMLVLDCISARHVERQRIVGAKYLGGPKGKTSVVLQALWTGLRAHDKVAVVTWLKTRKPALGVVVPMGRKDGERTLMVLEMAWAAQVREAPAEALLFNEVTLSAEEERAATNLVWEMRGVRADLDKLTDDRTRLRAEMLAAVERGEEWKAPKPPEVEEAEDLDVAAALDGGVVAIHDGPPEVVEAVEPGEAAAA